MERLRYSRRTRYIFSMQCVRECLHEVFLSSNFPLCEVNFSKSALKKGALFAHVNAALQLPCLLTNLFAQANSHATYSC